MALDKLVDSAQLDAALTYEAGKIRAKLGSSAQISFDLANQTGFGDAIDAIPSGGGGATELQSDFIVIRKETITAGENSVTNARNHYDYLVGAKSIQGELFLFSIHEKQSYIYNEYACGEDVVHYAQNGKRGYRYRNGWAVVRYADSTYDAKLVEGTVIDIYTYEIINPANA